MDCPSKMPPESPLCERPLRGDVAGSDSTGPGFNPSASGGKRKKRKGRWARGLLLALILVTCLYWFHVPILRGVAGYLVVDEPAAAADYLLVLPGVDGRNDYAAQQYHSGSASRILLVKHPAGRLERLGLQASFESLTRHELASRGVPQESIKVLPGKVSNDWNLARRLLEWLQQQPDIHVVVVCDRFGGRRMRHIFDSILGAEYSGRVRLTSLPDRSYDENNWWKHRLATVDVFQTYVRLAYVRMWGEDREEGREWDPEEFKKTLR
jgi:hypothetical protein